MRVSWHLREHSEHSLLAAHRSPFAIRHSLLAIRYSPVGGHGTVSMLGPAGLADGALAATPSGRVRQAAYGNCAKSMIATVNSECDGGVARGGPPGEQGLAPQMAGSGIRRAMPFIGMDRDSMPRQSARDGGLPLFPVTWFHHVIVSPQGIALGAMTRQG